MKVLLIEDESRVVDFLRRGLKAELHSVTVASNGVEGLKIACSDDFDVIILDLMLPEMHGHDVCQTLRQRGVTTPILMLTAMDSVENRIVGLRLGADDYLTKPFSFDELVARIEALARRGAGPRSRRAIMAVGDLVLDRDSLEVTRGGRQIKLTAKELAILELLMSSPGKVLSRERILSNVWGANEDPLTNIVDVYIGRLRRALTAEGEPPLIETLRGHGYRILRSYSKEDKVEL